MIVENLESVRSRIARSAERSGREVGAVTLVGVSKTVPPDRIALAHAAGLRHFGENRVQEAENKIEHLGGLDATWHLVGHLQTNKARLAARLFGMVQSVDSVRVAEALAKECVRLGTRLEVLLEVNYAEEESKFGLTAAEARIYAASIAALPGIRVRGLMTVAPFADDPEEVRPIFRGMRELSERVRGLVGDPESWHLSMGMTNDFEVAIEEGATIVRVGRAIFGERPGV